MKSKAASVASTKASVTSAAAKAAKAAGSNVSKESADLKKFAEEHNENKLRGAVEEHYNSDKKTNLTDEQRKVIEDAIARARKFDIEKHAVQMMSDEPFFCKISQMIKKSMNLSAPTAGVTINKRGDFHLVYNPFWMSDIESKDAAFVKGVLKHEYYHLILGHVGARRRDNHKVWNIATDLAINSLLVKGGSKLPKGLLMPGVKLEKPENFDKLPDWQQQAHTLMADLIESFAPCMSSEYYYGKLLELMDANKDVFQRSTCAACEQERQQGQQGQQPQQGQGQQDQEGDGDGEGEGQQGQGQGQEGDGSGEGHSHGDGSCDSHGHGSPGGGGGSQKPEHTCGPGGVDSFDDHSGWDNITDDDREYINEKIRKFVGEAVRHASQSNSWGSVPADMQQYLAERYSNLVDWRALLRQFTGFARGMTKVPSIKVINRRYPYVHPGIKRGRTANLWIYIDESGSVDDYSLELVFAELTNLARHMDIRIIPFDYGVREELAFTWRRGQKVPPRRDACGGTNFQAVVDHLEQNRGQCDAALIMTDGECGQPTPAVGVKKFGYIIVPDRELLFTARLNEICIKMKKPAMNDGEW